MRVTWSPQADAQVDAAVAHIAGDNPAAAGAHVAADNPAAALEWLNRLLNQVRSLAQFPDSGHVVPELRREDVREILVSPYRVMYRRSADQVEIAAVRHGARALDADEVALRGGALSE